MNDRVADAGLCREMSHLSKAVLFEEAPQQGLVTDVTVDHFDSLSLELVSACLFKPDVIVRTKVV